MKIGILTHYNVSSHGAYLQLYVMSRILQERGHEPFVLTYRKNFDFAEEDEAKKFQIGPASISYYIRKYLFDAGLRNSFFQMRKHRELEAFGRRTFSYAPYAKSDMDAAIIGADEVFSLQYGVNYMMYGHGVAAKSVFTYAPSFGQTDLERIERFHVGPLIAAGLASMQGLSVRDEGSAAVVEQLCDIKPRIVCDPALLYDFDREREKFASGKQRKPYALVYAYTTNMNEPHIVESIKAYARTRGLELVSIEGYHSWCDKNVVCDPVDMLAWFSSASAVITDTFHGTISSVITHAPLALFTRPTNTVKLGSLVNQLGLEEILVTEERDVGEVLSRPFSYERVEEKISALRTEGMSYLDSQLDACERLLR